MNETLAVLKHSHRRQSGRPANPLVLDANDAALLDQIATNGFWPEAQARKAKAVLAVAHGGRIRDVSAQLNYSPASIWRCRDRFRKGGVATLLIEGHRTGRPPKQRYSDAPLEYGQLSALSSTRPV